MLSFKQFPSKNVQPVSLSKINNISYSKSFQIEEIQRDARLDRIDDYFSKLNSIINSKTGSGYSSTYGGNEIKDIYRDIFNVTKIPRELSKKNDLIDEIVKYFKETYRPRNKIDTSNISIATKAVTYILDEDDDEY